MAELSFDEFCDEWRPLAPSSVGAIYGGSRLREDLSLDPLTVMAVRMAIDLAFGDGPPPARTFRIATAQSLYDYYQHVVSSTAGTRSRPRGRGALRTQLQSIGLM